MAYQQVSRCRFYVNLIEWLALNDYLTMVSDDPTNSIYRTLPVGQNKYPNYITHDNYSWGNEYMMGKKSFVAVLGHNLHTSSTPSDYYVHDAHGWDASQVINWHPTDGYDGFSISIFDHTGNDTISFRLNTYGADTNIGSIVLGTYYDMPHSADLNLTMTREYGGVKHIETKGGASLSNSFYSKPPKWGDLAPWELSESGAPTEISSLIQNLSRSGRRAWDLSFSYLDDGDVFGANQLISLITTSGISNNEVGGTADTLGYEIGQDISAEGNYTRNIITDDNFFSQVIHKTNGGQLPFIFQSDIANAAPDNFAICKFDMKSFQFKQVANGVYNIKLKIREIW